MREALAVALTAAIVGLILGRLLRRHSPRLAHGLHHGASALVQLLAAIVLARGVVLVFDPHNALDMIVAALFGVLAGIALMMAALQLYAFAMGPENRISDVPKSR